MSLTFREKIHTAIASFDIGLWEGKYDKEEAINRTTEYIVDLVDKLIEVSMDKLVSSTESIDYKLNGSSILLDFACLLHAERDTKI